MSGPDSRTIKEIRTRTRPTGSGFMLMLVLIAMLTASVNYGNNMAYLLTFLLFSLLLVGLMYTRNNLKGLDVVNLMPRPVYAGGQLRVALELHNLSKGRRYGIWLTHAHAKSADELSGPIALEASSNTTAEISFAVPKRGRFTLSRIDVITLYPLGLFMARGSCAANTDYLVYPKPDGAQPWPELEVVDRDGGNEGYHMKGGDDFTGTRPYRVGESMHHIDWKAVARGRPLSIKEFNGGGSTELCFNWDQLGGMRTESRLSQLCKWVLEADEQGVEFALKLPGVHIISGAGSTHTLKCLEALALFQTRR